MPRSLTRLAKRWAPSHALKVTLQRRLNFAFAPLYRLNLLSTAGAKQNDSARPRAGATGSKTQNVNKRHSSSAAQPAQQTSNDSEKWLVGIDGTKYGYLALEQAFRLANANDKIIGLHIPLDYQFVHVPLQYTNIFEDKDETPDDKKSPQQLQREETTNQIKGEVNNLLTNKKINKNNADFEFLVYDESVSPKYDLVRAADENQADHLVLGENGVSHSLQQKVEDTLGRILGSVSDYCVHKASCNVIIVKSKD